MRSRFAHEELRALMLVILSAGSTLEFALCCTGHLHWWVACLGLLVNLWGPLDAILRFPILHDLESIFTVKQLVCCCVKFVISVVAFKNVLSGFHLFLLVVLVNQVLFPM